MKNYLSLILITCFIITCTPNNKNLNQKDLTKTENQMLNLIKILNKDFKQHKEVGAKLTDFEIQEIEKKLGLPLPKSYKLFLKEFGNSAYWLYMNPIDDINKFSFLKKHRKGLGNSIELVGDKEFEVNSLLCLMTEDSNGGAWVWLTSENSENGEWPLAYYSLDDQKLNFKVENFTEWIRLLTKCKSEVIRELDKDNKLNLG